MSIGLIIFIVCTILWHYGISLMFKKAGIDSWKGYIPFTTPGQWLKKWN